MQFQTSILFLASIVGISGQAADKRNAHADHLSMIGNAHFQYQPTNSNDGDVTMALDESNNRDMHSARHVEECNPATDVVLSDYPQWQHERGYWIGEYTFLQGNGTPFKSNSWNYPYGNYKGFITGDVRGNAYRQRNVFLYPPQEISLCGGDVDVVGTGTCGVNGNTKIFSADQQASVCYDNEEMKGDIDGLYAGFLPTKTQLVGQDNALLYQVFYPAAPDDLRLLQSQLTTITEDPASGQVFRTRSAQGFEFLGFVSPIGTTTSSSYYRERKVNETIFYEEMQKAIDEYNILEDDLCKWDNNGNNVSMSGSLGDCISHLNESFALPPPPVKNSTNFTDGDSSENPATSGVYAKNFNQWIQFGFAASVFLAVM